MITIKSDGVIHNSYVSSIRFSPCDIKIICWGWTTCGYGNLKVSNFNINKVIFKPGMLLSSNTPHPEIICA